MTIASNIGTGISAGLALLGLIIAVLQIWAWAAQKIDDRRQRRRDLRRQQGQLDDGWIRPFQPKPDRNIRL